MEFKKETRFPTKENSQPSTQNKLGKYSFFYGIAIGIIVVLALKYL